VNRETTLPACIEKWRALLLGRGGATGFKLAAFFLSGMCLAYRKMWKATFVFYGIVLVETLPEGMLFPGFLGERKEGVWEDGPRCKNSCRAMAR
jgi:hypothetical protein